MEVVIERITGITTDTNRRSSPRPAAWAAPGYTPSDERMARIEAAALQS